MSRPARFRSLYWRIALGSFALLAVLLLVQAIVFLWMSGTIATTLLGQSPDRIAADTAKELAAELKKDPSLDIEKFVHEHYGSESQPLMIVMEDGRVARNHELPPPGARGGRPGEGMRNGTSPGAASNAPAAPGTAAPPGAAPGSMPATGPLGRRGGGGDRSMRPWGPRMGGGRGGDGPPGERAPIEVGGAQVGFVLVAGRGPRPAMFIQEFAPAQAVIGIVLLIAGSAVAAIAIFRPARRRLQNLERVAEAIGDGDLSARAADSGGDEVSALAHAFNRMAGDLEARTSAMEASDRMRRQLLADVSHELKTPLAAIRGYVETLAMPELPLNDDTRRRYLDIVGEETVRLEQIVGDLLDLARLDGGGVTFAPEAVAVGKLFQRVNDRHERELIENQITLDTTVPPGAAEVWADPARIEQALQNLVANAVRHTPEGGRIALEAAAEGDLVRLIVRDSGPGIPAEHLPHIFDRFYKADVSRSDPRSKAGSGLGLSIVKAIIERHGGRVSAANADGGGAEFRIELPRRSSPSS
jgi:signal transduction histidine kinase